MKQKLILVSTICFAVLVAFIIWSANTNQDFFFFRWSTSIPWGDKLAYFLLIGCLTLLLNLSLKNRRIRIGFRRWLLGSQLVFVIITLEEFSQIFIAARSFDWMDLTANYRGIFVFGLFAGKRI